MGNVVAFLADALTAAFAENRRVRISAGAELQEFQRGKEQTAQQLSQESEAAAAAATRGTTKSPPSAKL